MKYPETKLREIYLQQMIEVQKRLGASERYFAAYAENGDEIAFDSGVLQLRKALESVAYASIAPNKPQYQAFRQKVETNKDFTKDFNTSKIFQYLCQVNKDFYPMPLLPPVKLEDHSWHYDRKKDGILSQKRFQRFYDRLGKFLHSDNPWDSKKHRQNLAKDIDTLIDQARSLLELHAAFIRAKDYTDVWVVEVPKSNSAPKIISAVASGEVIIDSSS
jgi:hypothetical protein